MSDRSQRPVGMSASARHAAYSLVEVMITIVIIGGMFVAAMHTLGAARLGQRQTTDRARAHMLAQALMDEILRQAYEEPNGDPLLGLEADEGLDGTRSSFDDVDDYDGWSGSPPRARDGRTIAGFELWQRVVTVEFVEPTLPSTTATQDAGLKRIRVAVKRGAATVTEMVALRSRALDARRASGAIRP